MISTILSTPPRQDYQYLLTPTRGLVVVFKKLADTKKSAPSDSIGF
jgi:hypothetical protein